MSGHYLQKDPELEESEPGPPSHQLVPTHPHTNFGKDGTGTLLVSQQLVPRTHT